MVSIFEQKPRAEPQNHSHGSCSIGEALKQTCLPENVQKILLSATSQGTRQQYDSSLKKWMEFCKGAGISAWNPNLNNVLCFLANLYELGLSYSSINTAKSALSNVLGNIENVPVGNHPLVVKFMKGVSKLRPPTARYHVTWDANKLLTLFSSWEDNDRLDLKCLTLKLISLLALTTAQRVQSLASISVNNIKWGNPTQIVLTDQLKCSSLSKPNPVLIVNEYDLDKKLCVLSCLKCYFDRTSSYRKTDKLFISYLKPYNVVTSQTLSRWLKMSLDLAGIDSTLFKAHSFRHAATSKAAKSGLCIDSILSRVGWSSKSATFAKFYNRPIDDRCKFGKVVLDI